MKKKPSLTSAKKKAWDSFSLYIRTRDSLKTTGTLDRCVCVTCGRSYPRLGVGCIQAGHFIASRVNSILFDERGTNGQCYSCNVGRGGAHVEYFVWMEQNYGRDVIDELRALKGQPKKLTIYDLDEITSHYKAETAKLIA